MGRRKHRVKAFDEMSDGRIGELLWALREKGPSGPITIRRGEMISGRLRQAERAQTGVGHKSEFLDDRAGTPRFWQPEESRPVGPWPPYRRTGGPVSMANPPNYTPAAIESVIKQQIKELVWTISACLVLFYGGNLVLVEPGLIAQYCAVSVGGGIWTGTPIPQVGRLRFLRFRSAKR